MNWMTPTHNGVLLIECLIWMWMPHKLLLVSL